MDGANDDHLLRKLAKAKLEFDHNLDLGPCMAQILRYKGNPLQWPPFWNVGNAPRPGITGSAATDAFFNLLIKIQLLVTIVIYAMIH